MLAGNVAAHSHIPLTLVDDLGRSENNSSSNRQRKHLHYAVLVALKRGRNRAAKMRPSDGARQKDPQIHDALHVSLLVNEGNGGPLNIL